MNRRVITLTVAGGVIAAGAWLGPFANASTPSPGKCGATPPTPAAGNNVALPDGGTVFVDGSAAGGQAGITGPHGYLYVSGSPSNATVQGYNSDSGLNGKINVPPSSPSDVCISPN